MIFKNVEKKGVASIPLVMSLLLLIVSVGIFISLVSLSDSLSSSEGEKSNIALEYAKNGAQEALMRIARKPCYQCSDEFEIEMISGGCAGDIKGCSFVTYSPSVLPTSSQMIINANGQVEQVVRSIKVDVNLDTYGKIVNYDWQ